MSDDYDYEDEFEDYFSHSDMSGLSESKELPIRRDISKQSTYKADTTVEYQQVSSPNSLLKFETNPSVSTIQSQKAFGNGDFFLTNVPGQGLDPVAERKQYQISNGNTLKALQQENVQLVRKLEEMKKTLAVNTQKEEQQQAIVPVTANSSNVNMIKSEQMRSVNNQEEIYLREKHACERKLRRLVSHEYSARLKSDIANKKDKIKQLKSEIRDIEQDRRKREKELDATVSSNEQPILLRQCNVLNQELGSISERIAQFQVKSNVSKEHFTSYKTKERTLSERVEKLKLISSNVKSKFGNPRKINRSKVRMKKQYDKLQRQLKIQNHALETVTSKFKAELKFVKNNLAAGKRAKKTIQRELYKKKVQIHDTHEMIQDLVDRAEGTDIDYKLLGRISSHLKNTKSQSQTDIRAELEKVVTPPPPQVNKVKAKHLPKQVIIPEVDDSINDSCILDSVLPPPKKIDSPKKVVTQREKPESPPPEVYEKENPTNLRPFEDIHASLSPTKPSIKPFSIKDVLNQPSSEQNTDREVTAVPPTVTSSGTEKVFSTKSFPDMPKQEEKPLIPAVSEPQFEDPFAKREQYYKELERKRTEAASVPLVVQNVIPTIPSISNAPSENLSTQNSVPMLTRETPIDNRTDMFAFRNSPQPTIGSPPPPNYQPAPTRITPQPQFQAAPKQITPAPQFLDLDEEDLLL